MPIYAGACHCGAVEFHVDAVIEETTSCDCSLCVKKNARMAKVHKSALAITRGEDALSLYQWNTRVAKHYFCKHCGIYTFHRKRSAPDHYGVNVFCLAGFKTDGLKDRATQGQNMSVVRNGAREDWPGPRE
jgi:hypothetical protein